MSTPKIHKCILGNDINIGDSVIILDRWSGGNIRIHFRGHIVGFKENKYSWSAKVEVRDPVTFETKVRLTNVGKVMVLPESIVFPNQP